MHVKEDGLGGHRFQSQFKKTTLCKFFADRNCMKGDSCNFAHDLAEVQTAPDLTKTSLCRMYMSSVCNKRSESCPFAHGVRELRMTPMFRPKGKQRRKESVIASKSNEDSALARTTFKPPVDGSDSNTTRGSRKAPVQPSGGYPNTNRGSWWEEPLKPPNMMLPAAPPPVMFSNDVKVGSTDFASVEQYDNSSDGSSQPWWGGSSESANVRLAPPPPPRPWDTFGCDANLPMVSDRKALGIQMAPGIPVFLQGMAVPESMEALEILLKKAMVDQYED